ncbi:FecR family protein [bacterium]|nr:FecR family protein [bacterium]
MNAQTESHGWNGVVVKEVSASAGVDRGGTLQPIYKLGMALYEGDAVETDEKGRAKIQFSSNAEGNEIILGPSTRVRVSRSSIQLDQSVYRVTVLKGKIWARDLPSQSRKVHVSAGKSKIVPFGGDYIVAQTDRRTLLAGSSGRVRVYNQSTNRYVMLMPGEIASVSVKTGELTTISIPEQLMADFQSPAIKSSKPTRKIIRLLEGGITDEEVSAELNEEETSGNTAILASGVAAGVSSQPGGSVVKTGSAAAPFSGKESATRLERDATTPSTQGPVIEPSDGQKAENQGDRSAEAQENGKMAETSPAADNQQQPAGSKTQTPADASRKTQRPPDNTDKVQSPVVRKGQNRKDTKKTVLSKDRTESTAPILKREEKSLWQTFKWDIVTGTTALFFSWMSAEEASKYDALESKNKTVQDLWAAATTTSARTAYEVEYEVNKSKMSTHKSNVALYNNLVVLAVLFEGYLIYDHIFGSDPDDSMAAAHYDHKEHFIRPDTINLGLNNPSSGPGVRFSLGWKW